MFMIIQHFSDTNERIHGLIDTTDLFEAKRRFADLYNQEDPCEVVWLGETSLRLKRKNLEMRVFEIDNKALNAKEWYDFYYLHGDPNVALVNLTEVLKHFLPEKCFDRYKAGVNNLRHPEVQKNLSYEFGNFDGNWHRTSPSKGEYIGIYFGNRICDGLWNESSMPLLVKKFTRKIGKRKEENFLIFQRIKEIEKLNCLYK